MSQLAMAIWMSVKQFIVLLLFYTHQDVGVASQEETRRPFSRLVLPTSFLKQDHKYIPHFISLLIRLQCFFSYAKVKTFHII